MGKKKILFFCTFPSKERGFTGANIGNGVTYDLLKEYFDITVIDTGSNDFNPYEKSFKHFLYNISILKTYFLKYRLLYKTINAQQFDYLYFLPVSSLGGHFRDIVTVWICRSKVNKIVGHIRNGNFYEVYNRKWHLYFTKRFIESVDAFIFLSEELKRKAEHFLPASKTFVAFNPIDEEIICSVEEVNKKISEKKGSRDKLIILYLSNMIASKGYMDVAKAADILKKTNDINFTIHFIGRWNNKNDEKVMLDYIEENGLTEDIILHGKITDRQIIKKQLLQSDLFILPTYYPVEAQPRSIIEAINAATPVIATNHASIPEMIENGKDGIIVNKQNPGEIAQAILHMKNIDEWKQYARHCRLTYEKKFSKEAVKQQLLQAFF
jgi:glycosyltransferase involved in cell wall biosynthesis